MKPKKYTQYEVAEILNRQADTCIMLANSDWLTEERKKVYRTQATTLRVMACSFEMGLE